MPIQYTALGFEPTTSKKWSPITTRPGILFKNLGKLGHCFKIIAADKSRNHISFDTIEFVKVKVRKKLKQKDWEYISFDTIEFVKVKVRKKELCHMDNNHIGKFGEPIRVLK